MILIVHKQKPANVYVSVFIYSPVSLRNAGEEQDLNTSFNCLHHRRDKNHFAHRLPASPQWPLLVLQLGLLNAAPITTAIRSLISVTSLPFLKKSLRLSRRLWGGAMDMSDINVSKCSRSWRLLPSPHLQLLPPVTALQRHHVVVSRQLTLILHDETKI